LTLDGGELSALRFGHFTPEERASDLHWIWGWMARRAGPDVFEKKSLVHSPVIEPLLLDYPAR